VVTRHPRLRVSSGAQLENRIDVRLRNLEPAVKKEESMRRSSAEGITRPGAKLLCCLVLTVALGAACANNKALPTASPGQAPGQVAPPPEIKQAPPTPVATPSPLPSPPRAAPPEPLPVPVAAAPTVDLSRALELDTLRIDVRPVRSQFIEVFYGTNRARLRTCEGQRNVSGHGVNPCGPNTFYTGDAAEVDVRQGRADGLEVGKLTVAIPPNHKAGKVERPFSIFTLDLREEDPKKDVVISELSAFGSDYAGWVHDLRSTRKEHAYIFVHGYYTDFATAARQMGQIAYDLELDRDFGGVPMLYSWPSQGTLEGYFSDYDAALEAAPSFNHFLTW
jgi:hypothetical protein